ncbi:MAG: Cna B-type domain-containing protein [Oscillospiraceae bacterium]|nr:Cna B-type domain-containing protein [Oscillospiraceae bacterium]
MIGKKNLLSRAAAFMAAIAFLITLLLLFPAGSFRVHAAEISAEAAGMNITGSINLNGAPLVDNSSVKNGDVLDLRIDWNLPENFTYTDTGTTFVYDLAPKLNGITLTPKTAYVGNTAIYSVKDNMLYIQLLEGHSDREGYFSLNGTVNVDALNENNKFDLKFINTTASVFVTDLTPELKAYKSAGGIIYDKDSQTYYQKFTISLESKNQPSKNVTVTDIGESGFDFSKIKDFSVAYGDGTAIPVTPTNNADGFSITIPEVTGDQWNNKVNISYSVPIDVNGVINGTDGKKNTVTAAAANQDPVTSTADANVAAPSISKSGSYDAVNNKINWTITVNPGTLKDNNIDFTVTDIPGTNITADDLRAAFGDDLQISKSELTPDSNGIYTITYSTPVSSTNQTSDTYYSNSASVKFDGLPEYTSNEAPVTIEKEFKDFASKSYGSISGNSLPWTISVKLPASPATKISIQDYTDVPDKVKFTHDMFKINGTYTLAANSTVYSSASKLATDVGYVEYQGGTIQFVIVDQDFLSANANGEVNITYTNELPADLTTLTNRANVSIDVDGTTLSEFEAVTYSRSRIEKYLAPTDQFNTSAYEFPVVWGIKMQFTEKLAVGDVITVTDTLPEGLTLVDGAYKVSGSQDNGYSNVPQDCITASVDNATNTVTFTVTVTQQLINESYESIWNKYPLRIVYLTTADGDRTSIYQNVSKTYNNSASATKETGNNITDMGSSSCEVTFKPDVSKVVTKQAVEHEGTLTSPPYTTYTVVINPNCEDLSLDDTITATDTLGEYLTLDATSITVTPAPPSAPSVSGNEITFTLNDQTAYTISYNATVKTISTDVDKTLSEERKEELFGNTISVMSTAQSSYSTMTMLANYAVDAGYSNTQTQGYITIKGTKSWTSDEYNSGARPNFIEITLRAVSTPVNGAPVETFITEKFTPENDDWAYKFEDLPILSTDGTENVYYIHEIMADGYDIVSYEGDVNTNNNNAITINKTQSVYDIEITNDFTAIDEEVGSLTVTKNWENDTEADRPVLQFTVTDKSGNYTQTKTLTGSSVTFTNLPLYTYSRDNNNNLVRTPREYKITESVVNSSEAEKLDQYTMTKSYSEEYFVLTNDTSLTSPLATPVNQTITNTFNSVPMTSVTVTKEWDDADNQDGIRPGSVVVKLLANDVDTGKTETLNSTNNWTATFSNLEKKDTNGNDIVYTVDEENVPNGYAKTVNGFTITNKHIPEVTSVSVLKVWIDNNDQDGLRPEKIIVNLLADGTEIQEVELSASNNWRHEFTDLPKNNDGEEIEYTISEETVDEYTCDISGSADAGYTITNSHTPGKISIPVTKEWNDDNDRDGLRPASITVNLLADGVIKSSHELNSSNNWRYTFQNLDTHKNGKKINYTISENAIPNYSGAISGTAESGYTIKNTHKPEQISVAVTKVWDDNANQDGVRPANISINLYDSDDLNTQIAGATLSNANNWTHTFNYLPKYKNGGTEIEYVITEVMIAAEKNYTSVITGDYKQGLTVTNTHTPETISIDVAKEWDDENDQDGIRPDSVTIKLLADTVDTGKTITLNEAGNWEGSFTDLDKYRDEGVEIVYTVSEETVSDYDAPIISGDSANGFNVKNSHTPETVSIAVTKEWDDENDQDGLRPDSVTIKLLADTVDTGETITLNEAGNWEGSFTGLAKYRDKGTEIIYTVSEDTVAGYDTPIISGNAANGFNVKNSRTPEKITISGQKTWVGGDENNRPQVTVNLLAGGKNVASQTVSAPDWEFEFTGLDRYADGEEIVYSVSENPIEGYTPSYTVVGNNVTITNTYTPGKTFLNVTKEWDDAGDQDGIRPDNVTVELLANNTVIKTQVLSASNNWTFFIDLDIADAQGNTIVYSVREKDVPDGYTSSVSGNIANGFVITNKHTPATVSVSGTKIWDDVNNYDRIRPASIIVRLLADNKEVNYKEVTEADGWQYSFDNLPKYKDGTEIVYKVTEDAVTDYTTTYSTTNYDITNTHVPADADEKISVDITKTWNDNNNANRRRPGTLTVVLYQNGTSYKTISDEWVINGNTWTYSFDNLPKYDDNMVLYTYDVIEISPSGYSSQKTNAGYSFSFVNSFISVPENNPVVPNIPSNPSQSTPPPPIVTPVNPNYPEEDVSSDAGIIEEDDTLGSVDTTSYSYAAILLAVTAGGIVIARRRQK